MSYEYYKGLYMGLVDSVNNRSISELLPDVSEDDYQFIRYLDECLTGIIIREDMLWSYRSETIKFKLYYLIHIHMDMDTECDRIIVEWMEIRREGRISSIME